MSTDEARLPDTDALRSFIAGTPDAMLLLARDTGAAWTIVDCNVAACRLYGYARDELVGRSAAFLSEMLAEPPAGDMLGHPQQAGALRAEAVHRRPDGARVDVELALTPLTHAGWPLIVAVVRDITAYKRTARRLSAEHEISRLLAGAGHFMDVAAQMLRIIGEQLEWELGALWCIQGDVDALRCTATWQAPGSDAAGFEAASRALVLARGVGLPGTVWASGSPRWLADLGDASGFPRHAVAAQAHLHSAFAFPLTGPRSGIFGVMEFFSHETRPPDVELLGMAAAIGAAAGEYIERRRAETALRASEARKGAMLRAALDAIITIDHQGCITEFNPAAEALFGYRQAEALGREMAELLIPPSLREQHRQGLARYLAAGEARVIGRRIELLALHAEGSQFPIELTITRIPTDGAPVFTGFVRDITGRRRAEARQQFLAEASTLLSASLDYDRTLANLVELAVPRIADWCSINLLDGDGTLVRVGGRHIDPSKEAILRELREWHPPDLSTPGVPPDIAPSDRPTLIADVTDVQLQRIAQNEEQLRVYRAMGFRSAMLVPLRMSTRPLGIIIFATGESGRRFGPDDLALAEELAQRAALAIENARLYRQAQAAVQLRDEFLSVASHELKTPVTALLGYSQLLRRRMERERSSNDRDRRAVQIIGAQTERLATLVHSLLDVSRLELGQFSLERQPVDLASLVQRIAADLQAVLPPTEPPHTIDWSGPDEPLIVDGDALRLEQMVQNLVQNAVKYSPQGGPITLRLARDAGHAVLAVSDRGIGIPHEAQARLFQRFYRARHAAAHGISGMGIGLYVVSEIVSRHGGTVEVASTEGVGSTFTVRLPLAESPHAGG